CEKPLALNAPQAQQIVDAFRKENVLLAEAFMYRYHPQHATVMALIEQGVTGKPNLIDVCFTYSMSEAELGNVRLRPELGGGGLLDVGCYCVNLSRLLAGQEPESVTAQAVYGKKSNVDEVFVGTMAFPAGLLAHFDCGMRSQWRNQYTVSGPHGTITVDYAFRQPPSGEAIIHIQRKDAEAETIHIPPINQYTLMIEDFAQAVREGRKAATYDPMDSVRNMAVLDALDRSAREGIAIRL
ncbi:MAG TPA: Gfo/Idh/MocA family oxidoreductase, partial [Aggregatilineales bacterium]|nr:Gfo/Idh/MocA family oxidoreductase [Aggregatilineales bacterium]